MKTPVQSFTPSQGLSFNEFCQTVHLGNLTPDQREMAALIVKNCPTVKDILSFKNYFSQKNTHQSFALKAYINIIFKLAVAFRKLCSAGLKKYELGIHAFPQIKKQNMYMNLLNHLPY